MQDESLYVNKFSSAIAHHGTVNFEEKYDRTKTAEKKAQEIGIGAGKLAAEVIMPDDRHKAREYEHRDEDPVLADAIPDYLWEEFDARMRKHETTNRQAARMITRNTREEEIKKPLPSKGKTDLWIRQRDGLRKFTRSG